MVSIQHRTRKEKGYSVETNVKKSVQRENYKENNSSWMKRLNNHNDEKKTKYRKNNNKVTEVETLKNSVSSLNVN